MKTFVANGTGKLLLVHLTKGDLLLESIAEAARRAGIASGVVTGGIGSLRRLCYHYIGTTGDKPQDEYRTIEKPLELAALQGVLLEGQPHLHAVVTEEGSTVHAGHLEEGCEVQYLAEISILEIADCPLGRRAGKYGTVTHFEWLDGREAQGALATLVEEA